MKTLAFRFNVTAFYDFETGGFSNTDIILKPQLTKHTKVGGLPVIVCLFDKFKWDRWSGGNVFGFVVADKSGKIDMSALSAGGHEDVSVKKNQLLMVAVYTQNTSGLPALETQCYEDLPALMIFENGTFQYGEDACGIRFLRKGKKWLARPFHFHTLYPSWDMQDSIIEVELTE